MIDETPGAPDEATRIVNREVDEATRLRTAATAEHTLLVGSQPHPPADPATGRVARVPAGSVDHRHYGVRREALTVPVVRAPAPPHAAPAVPAAGTGRRRRPAAAAVSALAFGLVLIAAAALLVLLVVS